MKNIKIKSIIALAVFAASVASGCGNGENTADTNETSKESSASDSSDVSENSTASDSSMLSDKEVEEVLKKVFLEPDVKKDTEHEVGYQLEKPQNGDTVAVMETTMGTIKIRFFPEAAPKAVENFTTHAKDGYYDGLTFHRVIDDFMIQGGDPSGNSTGGESIWKENFQDEFSDKLFNIRGSLSMANSGSDTNASQFFINQKTNKTKIDWDSLTSYWEQYKSIAANSWESYKESYLSQSSGADESTMLDSYRYALTGQYGNIADMSRVSEAVKKLYDENGGNLQLDGAFNDLDRGHTVFGQVYEGMDVVDKIAAVEVDENDKPKKDVTIKSIKIMEYKG